MTRSAQALLGSILSICLTTLPAFAQAPASDELVYQPGKSVSLPRVTKQVHVQYTPHAARTKVRGAIRLTCIVSRDGTTREVRLVSGLDQDMDAKAVAALKRWEFEPGRLEGAPVAVRITVDMTFTTR
jgi:TonB family protein